MKKVFEKIIEKLEEEKVKGIYDSSSIIGEKNVWGKAIEIVKQGGVSDDVCEWKSVSDGEFIQNPHTKRLYSNEPSMRNVYCNTCGKKIKIVGD